MNKKLIAVALAALPVAAMADVTLYGTLKGSIENDAMTNAASQSKVQDNTSVLGFKGTEDLGNGLKTVWQIESRVNLDGSANSGLNSRQTFVGIDGGNLGMVRIGFINNPLNDINAVDQWQYNSTVGSSGANGLGIFTNSGDRLKNAVRYDSATFAGFSGSLIFGMGENAAKDSSFKDKDGNNQYNTNSTGASSNQLGLGLNYTYGDVTAHYVYQRETNPQALLSGNSDKTAQTGTGQHTAQKQELELGYAANNLYVGAAYQWATGYDWADDFAGDVGSSYKGGDSTTAVNPVAGQLKSKQAALSVAYTIGAFTPKFTYAKGWDLKNADGNIDNSGYRQYILGVDYALSKRTTVGFAYGNVNYGKNTSVSNADQTRNDTAESTTLKTVAFTMAHSF